MNKLQWYLKTWTFWFLQHWFQNYQKLFMTIDNFNFLVTAWFLCSKMHSASFTTEDYLQQQMLSWPLRGCSSQKHYSTWAGKCRWCLCSVVLPQKCFGKQHVLLKTMCNYRNARAHSFRHLKTQLSFRCCLKEYIYIEGVLFLLTLLTHSKSHNPAFKEIILPLRIAFSHSYYYLCF